LRTSAAFVGFASVLRHPQFLASVLTTEFLPWVLWQEPRHILRTYAEYAKAFHEILSVPYLLKTLLSPWKGIAEEIPSIVRWDQFLQAFFVNLVTRVIGMVIRLITIVLSIALQIALLALFAILFVGWFVFPILAVIGISFALILF
jgi:hypothetical protein